MSNDKLFVATALSFLAASFATPAYADPSQDHVIYLKCAPQGSENYYGKYTIDLDKNLVNNHPATIGPTAISWVSQDEQSDAYTHIHQEARLDRVTGMMYTETNIVYTGRGRAPNQFPVFIDHCVKADAPTTKF